MTKHERTGWRDTSLSNRHRDWGNDVPATDIDFVEYDRGNPIAICEWKHEKSQFTKDDSNMTCRRRLADSAGLPLFMIVRSDDMSLFNVHAKNFFALEYLRYFGINDLSFEINGEDNFVRFLYSLRGRDAPKSTLDFIRKNPFVEHSKVDIMKNIWKECSTEERRKLIKEFSSQQP